MALRGLPLSSLPNLLPYRENSYVFPHKSFKLGIVIQGEPERAPNTRETRSSVYLFIYLFVRDLAWQQPNAHACSNTTCKTVTGKGRQHSSQS